MVSLSDVTANVGGRAVTGGATYQDDTVNLDVTVDLDGKPAKVTGSIAGIEKLLEGEPAPVKLAVDAPSLLPAQATVNGGVFYKNDTLVLSDISAVSAPYTLTANGTYKDDILVLDPVSANLEGQRVSGTATANFAGDMPAIKAALTGTSTGQGAAANAEPAAEAAAAQENEGEQAAAPAPPPAANPMAPPPGGETEIAVAPPAKSEAEPAAPVAPTPVPAAAPTERGLGWRTEKLGVLALKGVDADVDLTLETSFMKESGLLPGRSRSRCPAASSASMRRTSRPMAAADRWRFRSTRAPRPRSIV
ncbi:hypothetical protein AUC71_01285 [Methyloceanibacter marginalis]|uniref:AsmA domain-containing protein n=1 Tax=Methyloceanibacter marginalis TaxID=1774971 RepID=A0A1E3WAU3_9HYPH|nr:hypothetical protein [Methyloceanibacter marginalis]ODS02906.1 hypothetical protein AUC71_01285 [Methyloceanibacter marginalis]